MISAPASPKPPPAIGLASAGMAEPDRLAVAASIPVACILNPGSYRPGDQVILDLVLVQSIVLAHRRVERSGSRHSTV